MRPRVFPAEDAVGGRANEAAGIPRSSVRSFNEAAGIPRGRRSVDPDGVMRHRVARRFNEAAGIPRGRRFVHCRRLPSSSAACFNEAAGIPRGRRPRASMTTITNRPIQLASMRPRVFPAEDGPPGRGRTRTIASASMRPRVFPAEDGSAQRAIPHSGLRFNEAAGIPRGRRPLLSWVRPGCFVGRGYLKTSAQRAFNEAAGIPRGRRWGALARKAGTATLQ